MEKSEKVLWDKCFESMSEDEYCSTTLGKLDDIFKEYLINKAAAYDRLMSVGKKTPKEVANFLGKPIALDSIRGIARWFWYDEVPTFVSDPEFQFCGWTSTKRLNELPADMIEYHGDWEGSLTLPDRWEEK